VVVAPHVVGSAGLDRILIDRAWYSDQPTAVGQPADFRQGFETFVAPYTAGIIGAAEPFTQLDGCGNNVTRADSLGAAGWWAACYGDNGTTVRAFDPNDHVIRDRILPSAGVDAFSPDSIAAIDAAGDTMYAWDPVGLRLTKLDIASGTTSVAAGSTAGDDLLTRIGTWLTPSAAAKVLLTPSLVLSPDGTRAYGLGIDAPVNESTTSNGVTVFDTSSMTVVGHWTANADYVSLTTNGDGSVVVLAAMASGGDSNSLTAVDAAAGTTQTTVGNLGFEPFFFSDARLP
jgi:hypothetical protein